MKKQPASAAEPVASASPSQKKGRHPSHGVLDQNVGFLRMLILNMCLLVFIASIACVFSYRQKAEELDSQTSLILTGLDREYRDITSSFWKIYMPLFEERNTAYETMQTYFSGTVTTPSLRSDLAYAMTQMLLRDDRVAWIALYAPAQTVNYILLSEQRQLTPLPSNFPYLARLQGRGMQIMGMEKLPGFELTHDTFAMCSSVPTTMGEGYILAGYSTSGLEHICDGYDFLLDSMQYDLISNGELVFSSSADSRPAVLMNQPYEGNIAREDGARLFVRSSTCGDNASYLIFSALQREMSAYKHQNTIFIMLIVLLFAAVSITLYLMTLRVITREVNVIQKGLRRISENDMNSPIQSSFIQAGLQSIAESVNEMASRLDRNINRAHYYELRQKEAELSELQSKFNPHFLYNTLEMLRNRCEQAGNSDVAELITDFSAIFRGFIGPRTFIPMKEELTSTRRYLSLLGARYEDQISIRYDFSRDILQYGIIRNVFQPLIENYFQYGFDTATEDNLIVISGQSLNETTMILSVADNGSGMSDSAIEALRFKLNQPVQKSQESYGLKNLHQRLKLLYGDDCGLEVERNGERGLKVNIIARKMTCEEYAANQFIAREGTQ